MDLGGSWASLQEEPGDAEGGVSRNGKLDLSFPFKDQSPANWRRMGGSCEATSESIGQLEVAESVKGVMDWMRKPHTESSTTGFSSRTPSPTTKRDSFTKDHSSEEEASLEEEEEEKEGEETLAALPVAMADVELLAKPRFRSDLQELLPIELAITADASRASLFRSLQEAFQGRGVKAEILKVEETKQTMNAAAFQDYILVDVDVRVEEAPGDEKGVASCSRAIFKHPSRRDAVRFERVFRIVASELRAAGIRVVGPVTTPGPALPDSFLEEDFNDEDDENDNLGNGEAAKVDWPVVLAPLLGQACCAQGWKREEAAVLLATMASTSPASWAPLAEALVQRQEVLHQLLLGWPPLATQYPAAAMLSSISACKELTLDTARVLQSLVLKLLLSGVSPLVAEELTHAMKNFSYF